MPRTRVHGDLPVRKVVVEESVFERAIERGREVPTEVAFFMIGLVRDGVAYVYDIVEFDYEERTAASVRSGVERKLRLTGILPLGLSLLGNMHKHPGSPVPSWIDREMFMHYARGGGVHAFVIYTVDPVLARAYTVHGNEIVEIPFEARELVEEEKLISFRVVVPLNVRVCVQKRTSVLELKTLLSSGLCRELEKQVYFPRLFHGREELPHDARLEGLDLIEVRPLRPVDIEASWTSGLYYRLYVDEEATDEDVMAMVREALGSDIRLAGDKAHQAHKGCPPKHPGGR